MTSICKNVGASEGGIATSDFANSKCVMSIDPVTSYEAEMADGICGTAILPKQVKTVAMAIPHRIEPRTRRACSTAVVNKPMKKTIRSGEAKRAFNFTAVPGSLMITPAWRSPMNAMNSPIPAAIPFFMLGLTELKISSRNPISDRIKKEHAGHEHDAERDLPTVGETGCRCRWNRGKNEEKFSPMRGA